MNLKYRKAKYLVLKYYCKIKIKRGIAMKFVKIDKEKFKPTKEEYARVRDIMKKHWKGIKKLEGLDLAAVYYFNHKIKASCTGFYAFFI